MAVDKNKIIAEATRLVQKGQYDKALKAYEKILAEDRKEVRTLLKVGEVQQKKGDNPAAAATFNQVAEIYGDQGFFLKAVAVYKQIAKLTPEDVRVNEKLAGLYQQLGLLNDATSQLQVVATAHEKAGDQGRHLDVLRRLLDLDPENVVTCQRLGDLYAKAGRSAEALELYRRAAAHLRENKRGDEYLKLAERIFLLTPEDLKLARELAQEYLARGDTKKALGKLQTCHGADKQDIDTLRLMAQAFRDLGQVSKTIAVYRALARVYAERGRREESALTWRMVLDLLPDDPEASEELGGAATTAGARPAVAGPPSGRPPGAFPVMAPATPPPPGNAVPPPRPASSPPVAERAVTPPPVTALPAGAPGGTTPVSRLLTETDVYLKYGLHQKALDHVQKILAEDGENPDALERIRDIRDAMGDRQGAAEAAERAVQSLLARGGEGRIEHAIERLRVLDPAHADVRVEEALPPADAATPPPADEMPPPDDDRVAEPGPESPAPPMDVKQIEVLPPEGVDSGAQPPAVTAGMDADASPALADVALPESELDLARTLVPPEDQGPKVVLDDEQPSLVLDDAPPEDAPLPLAEAPAPPAAELPGLDDGMLLDDAPVLEVEIAPAELEEVPAPQLGETVEDLPEEVDVADLEEIEVEDAVDEPAPAPPPLPEHVPPSLHAELEEVEFYEQQGLLDEAVLAVRELSAAHPGHPEVERARARIETRVDPDGAAPASEPEAAPDPDASQPAPYASTGTTGIFDLGAELSAELGPELSPTPTGEFQYSVADVFEQFKKGLEKTVRPDDSATKYDLGIAFQEMGMLDEALEQFRSALAGGDRRREVEILNMIGVCLGMKGEHREAVETYRQALRSEFLVSDGARAIHFELGAAHEALGEPEVALWYFQKIAHGDPGFRGAGERVARLGGGPGTPPDGGGHQALGLDGGGEGSSNPEAAQRPGRKNAGSR